MNPIKLDINKLHKVPEILETRGSYGRQFGKTEWFLQNLVGYVEVLENTVIPVLIHHHKGIPPKFARLFHIFKERGLEPIYDIGNRRIRFKNNTNEIKFLTLDTIQRSNPLDYITDKNDALLFLLHDLENMPPEFYRDSITLLDSIKLNKYLTSRFN